jgi:Phage derived protein Gp49-like (DUF891)
VQPGQTSTPSATASRVAGELKGEPSGLPRWRTTTVGGPPSAHPVWRYAEGRQAFQGCRQRCFEIALRYASEAYLVVVAIQIGRRIYVLHAFQKKSKKGIETPKRDVDLIRKRYKEAQELAREFEKTKTN